MQVPMVFQVRQVLQLVVIIDHAEDTKLFQRNIEASFSVIASSNQLVADSTYQKQCKEAASWYLDLHRQYSNEPDGPHKLKLKEIMEDAEKMYQEVAKEKAANHE